MSKVNMCFNNVVKVFFTLSGIALLGYSIQVQTNEGNEPIYIESNSTIYDDNKNVSTYIGDVIAKQGSLTVKSDELIVYFLDGKVNKLKTTGKPVHFTYVPGQGKEAITGKSLEADYFPEKSLLLMRKEAVVWQGQNTYASEIIRYNNKDAVVRAGEESTDRKRVHVIIQQNNNKTVANGQTGSKKSSEKIQE